jgi:PleD family two-component response regulator
MTASIGVALAGGSPVSLEAILKAADGAMYTAKRAGGDRVVVARPPMAPDDAVMDGEILTALC